MILGALPVAATGDPLTERVSPGAELRPGQTLDERFLIIELISRGGMATVYQAEDLEQPGQLVAIKIPHREYEFSPAYFARFQREEEIGITLRHPAVLRFITVNRPKSRPYLVTEYLRGTTLLELMRTLRIFPEKDALAIGSLICSGVQYLHERGILHRDLKPENIMVCFDGSIRLMDFGIAQAEESRRITFIGAAPGTPEYIAPERVHGKRGDARTDIYSLGVILYEMLTGKLPFPAEDPLETLNARVTGDPPALRHWNAKISPAVEEVVLQALERNPAARHPTVMALRAELDHPGRVIVTGRCHRLQLSTPGKRRWRQVKVAALWCLVPILAQVVLFLLMWQRLAKK